MTGIESLHLWALN